MAVKWTQVVRMRICFSFAFVGCCAQPPTRVLHFYWRSSRMTYLMGMLCSLGEVVHQQTGAIAKLTEQFQG